MRANVPGLRVLGNELITFLEDLTGQTVVDEKLNAEAPPPPDPYLVLNYLGVNAVDGPPLSAPEGDAAVMYQVTAVGMRRDQVHWLADLARKALIGRAPSGRFLHSLGPVADDYEPGVELRIMDRQWEASPGAAEETGTLRTVVDRYTFVVTTS